MRSGTAILDLPIWVPVWKWSKLKVRKSSVFVVLLLHMCRTTSEQVWQSLCGHKFAIYFQFIHRIICNWTLFLTEYSRITFINSGESEISNDKCKVFEFALQIHAWLDQVCIAFRVRVWVKLQVHIFLLYCNSGLSCTGSSKISVPVFIL